MRRIFTEFCSMSTVHGIRYFTEQRRHWSERCWWLIAIVVSFVLCGNSIRAYWMNWSETPVRFTEEEQPISSIPFPTVRCFNCQNSFYFTNPFRFISISPFHIFFNAIDCIENKLFFKSSFTGNFLSWDKSEQNEIESI